MNIVKWLMGRPIVAVWVLLGVAILLAFGSSGDENDVFSSTATSQLEKVNTKENFPIEDKVAASIGEADVSSVSSLAGVDEATKTDKVKSSSTPLDVELNSVEGGSAQASNSNSADNKESAITDLSQLSGDEMLLMAREAYWNNGLDEAAQIYMKLIKTEPNILEHKGELGNVFWRQGYPKKAAELYSEIAIPMIESGNSERVANMIGFIGLFYPDRAALIHQKMQSNLTVKEKEADKLIEVGIDHG